MAARLKPGKDRIAPDRIDSTRPPLDEPDAARLPLQEAEARRTPIDDEPDDLRSDPIDDGRGAFSGIDPHPMDRARIDPSSRSSSGESIPEDPLAGLPTLDEIPDGAQVWENRSGVEGSGYFEMSGPDIVYHEDVWYIVDPHSGQLQPVQTGPHLDLTGQSFPIGEAIVLESTHGTALWNTGAVQHLGLGLHGPSGDLVTPAGTVVDPDALAHVQAADGTRLFYDTESGSFFHTDDLDQPLPPGQVPPGPYTSTGGGDGFPPPFDGLPPGTQLVFDPYRRHYEDPDSGNIVAFHETVLEGAREWENRSDHRDSPYEDMSGPDIHYIDGIWYAEMPDGSFEPFARGRYLDFTGEMSAPGEAIWFEATIGTPIYGQNPADHGLRLDGETGLLVDENGKPAQFQSDPDGGDGLRLRHLAFGEGTADDIPHDGTADQDGPDDDPFDPAPETVGAAPAPDEADGYDADWLGGADDPAEGATELDPTEAEDPIEF